LNLRPLGPQPSALPDCATPRGDFILTDRRVRCRCERLFDFVCSSAWGDAHGARQRNRMRISRGVGAEKGNAIPIAGLAAPSTSRSTIGPTNSAISTPPGSGTKLSYRSGSSSSWPISATIRASTAARPIPSCSSSITSEIKDLRFRPASGAVIGATCSMRLQSATSFVQTVTGVAPRGGAASFARR
jgi:hypothetical protein